MSNSGSSGGSGGIGFIGLLTIVFIVLKLCGVISWSWWWVLSPIWIIAISVVALVGLWLLFSYLESRTRKKLREELRRKQ